MLTLPDGLFAPTAPIFDALPLSDAMPRLVGPGGAAPEHLALVERACDHPELRARPELRAGLWLYVDELDRSHAISQTIESPTGSFWHAIMHRREGDFSNAKYWYRRVGQHPAMNRISIAGGSAAAGTDAARYDPDRFVDRVETAHHRGETPPELLSLQHREWKALFEWCAEQP